MHSDTILQVATLFQGDSTLAAAIGSYDDAPGAPNFLSQYKNLFHHYTHQTSRSEASTFWGACGAIRRDIFWQVGGFDQRYRRPSIEDIELGYRLKQQGYAIRLCKTLYVKHLKRWEPISLLRAEFFYRALPWTELLLQQRQTVNDLNLNQITRLSVVLTYGLMLCLLGAGQWPLTLLGAGVISLLLLVLNHSVYQFFHRQRGTWFMVQTIPWHWLYFGYCGLAYGLGLIRHHLRQSRSFYRLSLRPLFSTFELGR
ncbi:MAG: glycosyltransferase family 2 protein [Nodosilinea sp. LVE1205-7]